MNEIQSINEQMARIANLARAYANATPEQRNNVSRADMQAQLDRYNELKARRNELYAEQENRVQAELEALRRANQQQAQQTNRQGGRGRQTVNNVSNNNNTQNPSITEVPHDYSKDQSFVPGMTMNPRYVNNGLPAYDERYDVNSPNYVYNKGGYNIGGQYVVNPEYQGTYGRYDAGGRLISDEVLNERQAYQDTLNMPWEKLTGLNNEDLLMAAAPYANEIAGAVRGLGNIPYVRFNNVGNTLKSLPGGTNNYLTQGNNFLTQGNNFLTNQSVGLQRAYQGTPRVNSWSALERLRNL